jgi:hypothetical protein
MKYIILASIAILSFNIGLGQNITPSATYDEVVNKKVKGLIQTYISKSGEKFSVGDTITLGTSFMEKDNFTYVVQNVGIDSEPLSNLASGRSVIIKKIKISMRRVTFSTTPPKDFIFALKIGLIDDALKNGELKSKIMSSSEALAELKRAKDKLDLGLTTQEEFDALRNKLAPFID